MKRFEIKNKVTGFQFGVEREELGELQPEWGEAPEIVVTDLSTEVALKKAKRAAREAKLTSMRALKNKTLNATQMREALEFLLSEVFDENSSLSTELARYAASSKS